MLKKGFTLIELLAVIIIVTILSSLVGLSIVKLVQSSKENLYNSEIVSIKEAAKIWSANNLSILPKEEACIYLKLGDLKEEGLLDESIINPKTNKEFSDDLIIKILSKENSNGSNVIEYEVDSNSIGECTYIY